MIDFIELIKFEYVAIFALIAAMIWLIIQLITMIEKYEREQLTSEKHRLDARKFSRDVDAKNKVVDKLTHENNNLKQLLNVAYDELNSLPERNPETNIYMKRKTKYKPYE